MYLGVGRWGVEADFEGRCCVRRVEGRESRLGGCAVAAEGFLYEVRFTV